MILFILGGVFLLTVCIFIHELGHYLCARLVGIEAEIFSIGYGKGIWKKKIGVTTWQITAIPLGGYVKFYGDDLFSSQTEIPGGLMSIPPLKRIIPVLGGPFFNLLLGFFAYIIVHSISGPLSSKIYIWEEMMTETPAYRAGLKNGDTVVSINGNPVKDFMGIQKEVAFSSGKPLKFSVEREGELKEFIVSPEVQPSGTSLIGIRPPGERYLEVKFPTGSFLTKLFLTEKNLDELPPNMRALPYLNDGDIILQVNDKDVHSIVDLQKILGQFHNEEVSIKVRRQQLSWLTPLYTKVETVKVPSRGEFRINVKEIVDLKYNMPVSDQNFTSTVKEFQRGLSLIKIDGSSPGSYEKLFSKYPIPTNVHLNIKDREYQAKIQVEKIGVLGFQSANIIESDYLDRPESVSSVITASIRDTWANIAMYPMFFKKLFSGRMSFIDNAIGPVGMFAVAGSFIKSGFMEYMQLMASISIALLVMNLMPFPVVDGGHIVFYLYEAIVGKPVSPAVMELLHKIAFSVLMFFGIWIMYRDILMFVL